MKQGQFPVIFNLMDLNGANGFKLDGEAANDQSGFSVNAAGDVNGDGYVDFILGSPYHNNKTGRSYVIFGNQRIGSQKILELSDLNGANGFKIDDVGYPSESGYSVSDAGDINGDHYADIIIGAPFYGYAGLSYVILGSPTVGDSGILARSSLNGSNGFTLVNDDASSCSFGFAVSGAGDVNGDKYADLLVGAPFGGALGLAVPGWSYLIFGGPNLIASAVSGKGLVYLTSLFNGINGFRLDGEKNYDNSGMAVSHSGDINGDGYADVLVGAPNDQYGSYNYVVFGTKKGVDGGMLPLSTLNGVNGFKIISEQVTDLGGLSLDSADDVNGDGYTDIIIGAPYHNFGRSYVIFGAPNIGSNSTIALEYLSGANGFKLEGESDTTRSGFSVSGAGDFNGDGYADLVIGAPNMNSSGIDRSYVVFGSRQVGGGGLITLADLNGKDGFKFQGESLNSECGYSVHGVGDVNGDGCDDIIISAPYYNNKAGRSYLVFGDAPPILINNTLSLFNGEKVLLNATHLAATDRNHDNSSLIFVPASVTYGQFEAVNAPGKAIINFTQSQITQGEIQFVHDGSYNSPAYNISVYSTGIAWTGPIPANVSMIFLRLDHNQLRIDQGQSVMLTSDNLSAEDSNGFTSTLTFKISGVAQGQFEFSSSPGQAIIEFQQQNISDHVVNFVHDNSVNSPAYKVSVSNGDVTISPQAAIIDFDARPILNNNHLTIDQSEVVTITSSELSATHPGGSDATLSFQISTVQHGNFQWSSAPGKLISVFQQQNITDRLVNFAHDSSLNPPAYVVTVTDGRLSSDPQAAVVDFNQMPTLGNNQLIINQGQTVTLSSDNLSASQASRPPGELIFLISACQQGYFEFTGSPGKTILTFQQQNITSQVVRFVHDNSQTPPAYSVSVSDGHISTPAQAASIDFDIKPVLKNNQLTINQGQAVILTTSNLFASHPGTADSELNFVISTVKQGYFAFINTPNQVIQTFTQQHIIAAQVQFHHDNTPTPPAYQVSVTDGRASSDSQTAKIDFDALPILKNNQLLINQGQTVTITANDLSAVQPGGVESQLSLVINNYEQGYFQLSTSPGNAITRFQQQDITNSRVQFVHDKSVYAPAYQVMVTDGRVSSDYEVARIDFDMLPVLQHNRLSIDQGQTVILTEANLRATHDDGSMDDDLIFLISGCQHGYFSWTNTSTGSIVVFRQHNITTQAVSFIHDDSYSAPSYLVSVTDGRASSDPQAASINFNGSDLPDSGSLSVGALAGIVVSTGVVLLGGIIYKCRQKSTIMKEDNAETKSTEEYKCLPSEPVPIKDLEVKYGELEFTEKDKIGSGGSGAVYRGKYQFNPVAIKKLHAISLSATALEEFKKEAGIMASMRSDFIVQLRGVCTHAPNFCLVMELMPKGSLDQLLKTSSNLPLVVLLRIGLDVIHGLCQLHKRNILHRDLKSLNVLLDDRLRAKISDFGLSKIKSETTSMTSAKILQGTLGWVAPELFEEKSVSTKAADIYAYGMILWELVNKPYRAPFQSLAYAALVGAKLNRGDKQETVPTGCPKEISTLMQSCWRKATKRPTASQIAMSLEKFFKTLPDANTSSAKTISLGSEIPSYQIHSN